MLQILLRVLVAATLSATGFFATEYWSRSNRVKTASSSPVKPVARLVSISNEVMRRPPQRLIWTSINRNEDLYPGEAIRTSNGAEAEIEFPEHATTVRLDPDSVIEIESRDGRLNLDFLKGNLFIKSAPTKDGAAPAIDLRSGEQKIALANSEISVSKVTTTAKLDVEVFKGEAKLFDAGKEKPIDQRIRILRPRPDEAVYIHTESEDPVAIVWQPIDESYEMSIEVGDAINELKPLSVPSPVSGSRGSLMTKLPLGKHYYRLKATSRKPGILPLQSSILRAEVRAKIPPVPLQPSANAFIQAGKEHAEVAFRWSNPGQLEAMVLEVWKQKNKRHEMVFSGRVGENLVEKVPIAATSGQYFWRVKGHVPGLSSVDIASPIQTFHLKPEGGAGVTAPILASPQTGSAFPLAMMKEPGVLLEWKPVIGASSYVLTFSEDSPADMPADLTKVFKRDLKTASMRVRNLKPGNYSWSVAAKDSYGQTSPESEKRGFVVEGASILAWKDGLTRVRLTYKTTKPTIRSAWENGPQGTVSWRVSLRGERSPASETDWKTVPKPEYETTTEAFGIYVVEAEALDAKGLVLARTAPRTVETVQAPPLAPPNFDDSMPLEIQARSDGSVDILWKAVPEAREYEVRIVPTAVTASPPEPEATASPSPADSPDSPSPESARQPADANGTAGITQRIKGTKGEFTRIRPGDYKVSLFTVDSLDRLSAESEVRPMKVPEWSDVPAPKLRSINVK